MQLLHVSPVLAASGSHQEVEGSARFRQVVLSQGTDGCQGRHIADLQGECVVVCGGLASD